MHTALDAITQLHAHRRWARDRVLALVRPLGEGARRSAFEMGPGSVMGVLAHCYGAELAWINVLERTDPSTELPGADAFPTLEALEAAWAAVDARWDAWMQACRRDPARLTQPAVRRRQGKDYATSAADVMLHVCTHQHYHMAQLTNMLRRLGVPIPAPWLDLIVMAREQWAAPGA